MHHIWPLVVSELSSALYTVYTVRPGHTSLGLLHTLCDFGALTALLISFTFIGFHQRILSCKSKMAAPSGVSWVQLAYILSILFDIILTMTVCRKSLPRNGSSRSTGKNHCLSLSKDGSSGTWYYCHATIVTSLTNAVRRTGKQGRKSRNCEIPAIQRSWRNVSVIVSLWISHYSPYLSSSATVYPR